MKNEQLQFKHWKMIVLLMFQMGPYLKQLLLKQVKKKDKKL